MYIFVCEGRCEGRRHAVWCTPAGPLGWAASFSLRPLPTTHTTSHTTTHATSHTTTHTNLAPHTTHASRAPHTHSLFPPTPKPTTLLGRLTPTTLPVTTFTTQLLCYATLQSTYTPLHI